MLVYPNNNALEAFHDNVFVNVEPDAFTFDSTSLVKGFGIGTVLFSANNYAVLLLGDVSGLIF